MAAYVFAHDHLFPFAGIESFSKLGDSIYFEEKGTTPSLYIIQYISSSFNWRSAGVVLSQKTKSVYSFDPYLQISIRILTNQVPIFLLWIINELGS